MNRPWIVISLAFLAQNLAIGLTFGAYGLLIGDIADEFSGSRSQVSFGIALITLVMGLFSPALGYVLDRWSIRGTMMIGAALTALGFQLGAHAQSLTMFLTCFGLLVGAGITCMGVLPAGKLAANWFPQATGKALGFVSLPILIAVGPPLFGWVIEHSGWRELFRYFSYVYLGFLPLLLLVRNHPEGATAPAQAAVSASSAPTVRWRDSLADKRLWLMVLIGGIMFSGGIVLVTHVVQHAVGFGIDLAKASLLLSVNGIAAVVGAMLFGWLSDRLSPAAAVTINLAVQALMWPFVLMQTDLTGLILAVSVLGICGGGAHPALSALVGSVFGAQRFGTILGQITLLVIPFNFGAAPLAGWLYDINGSYAAAFILYAGLCLFATVVMALLGYRMLNGRSTPDPVPG